MTALKPVEGRLVRGVASTRYPLNRTCAHPECSEQAQSAHHVFPRSLIGNGSWFVVLGPTERYGTNDNYEIVGGDSDRISSSAIPHVVGLCGDGVRGHHGDLEEHRAWIKLEDGEFVWYQRVPLTDPHDEIPVDWQEWARIGALNPQPGSVEGRPKRKRTVKGSSERAARKTVSIRLPEGVDGDYWDELIEETEKVELSQPDTQFDPVRGSVSVGKLLVATLERFTGRAA